MICKFDFCRVINLYQPPMLVIQKEEVPIFLTYEATFHFDTKETIAGFSYFFYTSFNFMLKAYSWEKT